MRASSSVSGLSLSLVLLTLAVGCRSGSAGSSSSSSSSASAAASADARVSTSPTSSASSGASPDTGAAAPVDLLRHTGAALAVSSNVDNPRDFPEHLVDGNPSTAWNGRSGDLGSAWIAFRVPVDAYVARIELTAGFDKKGADGDLFTMNHRIKRVRVRRDGKVLREHTLDVDARGPQAIPVDTAGGSFRIEILETVPGSKKEWREVCVSELRVPGAPSPDSKPSASAPQVGIGAFPNEGVPRIDAADGGDWRITAGMRAAEPVLGRGWPSLADFCRAHDAAVGPLLDRMAAQDVEATGTEIVPRQRKCTVLGPLSSGFVPTDDVKSVTRVRVFQENWTEDRIAIETKNGFFVAEGEVIESASFLDPGCFGHTTVTVQSVRANGGAVEIVVKHAWKNRRYLYHEDGGVDAVSDSDDISRHRLSCALAGSRMKCTSTEIERVCHVDKEVVDCKSF